MYRAPNPGQGAADGDGLEAAVFVVGCFLAEYCGFAGEVNIYPAAACVKGERGLNC